MEQVKRFLKILLVTLVLNLNNACGNVASGTYIPVVRVNKCCEVGEIFIDGSCASVEGSNETEWKAIFTNEIGQTNLPIKPEYVTGSPDCGSHQQWLILYYEKSPDVLRLLPTGVLRHITYQAPMGNDFNVDYILTKQGSKHQHDYQQGQYCLDKRVGKDAKIMEYALVCLPEQENHWTSTEFLMRNIVNPITHMISLACLLTVAIVYFVMPTLKDLVGNIISTMTICLIVSQTADLIRLLTVFTNHVSLIITETVCYISLLGAFFWLNSLAYYIWKTFRSRNVYLRITDSKKYCYYSAYAWSCTIIMGFLAIFAHYTMDYETDRPLFKFDEQEQIGSLGMIIFFMPVAFTILVNIFFLSTTIKILGRMNTYGRIHHKLKHSFRMFVLLFLIMSMVWIFFLMSFSKFDGLVYCYIIVNAFQAPLILYICLFNQKHVSYLLRKTCCYLNCLCSCCRPDPEPEWGDEMTAMNNGIY